MARDPIKPCVDVVSKVRLVARIRGFRDQELATSVINVRCSGDGSGTEEKVSVSFDDPTSSRKKKYTVDCCYTQSENNGAIFLKEVKPHISKVFDGESSTFFAFGAKGSGKTYTIQGTEENLGLGMLAIDELLRTVEGGRHKVAVSIYEVLHSHVYDLLDKNNKEVQILEDAHRKITLKGLSKVNVTSLAEFQKLYCGKSSSKKPPQKIPRRSHKALMIHILASDEEGNTNCAGKLNFVDLAGYENTRSGGTNFNESTQINKSLNALLNVLYAINASESRVPNRESKLARMLQDYVGGTNNISMLVCLNPLFCPDTIHAITLASRIKNMKPVSMSCSSKKHFNSQVPISSDKTDPGASSCSTTKQTNPRYPLSAKKRVPFSANKANPGASVSTTKKQTNPRFPLSAKKTNVVQKGRKLFGVVEQAKGIKEQASSMYLNLTSMGDLTKDVMWDVLSRLDFKTVCYCQCVCKRWRDLVLDPYFISKLLWSNKKNPSLMIHDTTFDELGRLKWIEIQDKVVKAEKEQLVDVDLSCPGLCQFPGSGLRVIIGPSVNGLIGVWDTYGHTWIINPTAKQYLTLPDSQSCSLNLIVMSAGYGFGSLDDATYKVINIFDRFSNPEFEKEIVQIEVFTLGTNNWRELQPNDHLNSIRGRMGAGLFFNGGVHWINHGGHQLFVFELDNETFNIFPSPPFEGEEKQDDCHGILGVLKGCLSQGCYYECDIFTLWVMREHGVKDSWYKAYTIKETGFARELFRPLCLFDGLKGGTLIANAGDKLVAYCLQTNILRTISLTSSPATCNSRKRVVKYPNFLRLKTVNIKSVTIYHPTFLNLQKFASPNTPVQNF